MTSLMYKMLEIPRPWHQAVYRDLRQRRWPGHDLWTRLRPRGFSWGQPRELWWSSVAHGATSARRRLDGRWRGWCVYGHDGQAEWSNQRCALILHCHLTEEPMLPRVSQHNRLSDLRSDPGRQRLRICCPCQGLLVSSSMSIWASPASSYSGHEPTPAYGVQSDLCGKLDCRDLPAHHDPQACQYLPLEAKSERQIVLKAAIGESEQRRPFNPAMAKANG